MQWDVLWVVSVSRVDTSGSQNKLDLRHHVIYYTGPLLLAKRERRHGPFTGSPGDVWVTSCYRKELLLPSGCGCDVSLRGEKWLKNEDLSRCFSDIQIPWKDALLAGREGTRQCHSNPAAADGNPSRMLCPAEAALCPPASSKCRDFSKDCSVWPKSVNDLRGRIRLNTSLFVMDRLSQSDGEGRASLRSCCLRLLVLVGAAPGGGAVGRPSRSYERCSLRSGHVCAVCASWWRRWNQTHLWTFVSLWKPEQRPRERETQFFSTGPCAEDRQTAISMVFVRQFCKVRVALWLRFLGDISWQSRSLWIFFGEHLGTC